MTGTGPGRSRRREEGIALYFSLVVFLVLVIVVYNLSRMTENERKIAENRTGHFEMFYAFQSVAREVMAMLEEDYAEDLEERSTPLRGQGESITGGPRAGETKTAEAAKKAAPVPATAPAMPGQGSGTVDHLHEKIFQRNTLQVNGVEVLTRIRAGSQGFDLNRLFDYAPRIWEEEKDQIERIGEDDDKNTDKDKTGVEEELKKAVEGREDLDAIKQALVDAGMAAPEDLDAILRDLEEWQLPDQARVQRTEEMIARLIEEVVYSNEENGFFYQHQYLPEVISRNIVNYILERKQSRYDGYLYLVSDLLDVPGVTRELFYGPEPEFEMDQGDVDYGPDGPPPEILTRDKFGEFTYNYPTVQENLSDYVAMGNIPGISDLSVLSDLFLREGLSSLGMNQYLENEDGTGLYIQPLPIGLRDVFSTYSEGRINLNLAPKEVIMALLLSVDRERARWFGYLVEAHRNMYVEEPETEGMDVTTLPTTASGMDVPLEDELFQSIEAMTAEPKTNHYTAVQGMLDALSKLDETDELEPPAATHVTRGAGQMLSLYELIQFDLNDGASLPSRSKDAKANVGFASQYFVATLKASKGKVLKEATMALHRDPAKRLVKVLLWKEKG